jgi:hypothetical protein
MEQDRRSVAGEKDRGSRLRQEASKLLAEAKRLRAEIQKLSSRA